MRALRNYDEQVVVAPCPSSLLVSLPIIPSHIETAKNDHLRLAFGREGGGGGNRVGTTKITTSSLRLDTREVVAVADSRNNEKNHLQLAFEC
jgi:hypothetical protein